MKHVESTCGIGQPQLVQVEQDASVGRLADGGVECLYSMGDLIIDQIHADLEAVVAKPRRDRAQILSVLTPREQVALLLAAVRRLPGLRVAGDYRTGELLYDLVAALYRSRLSLGEAELCALLRSSRHDCGHGADTRPPFDVARRYQQHHGYSPAISAAIREFVDNLPRSGAVKIQNLRRSAALLAVLDTDLSDVRGVRGAWWINQVRASLAAIQGAERRAWERLALSMTVSERMVLPQTFDRRVQPIINELGPERVVGRLAEWWPQPPSVSLRGSGAQLLKHFIWMLERLPRADGEPLVCLLAEIQWQPRSRPFAVLKPAAAYLVSATSPSAITARNHFLVLIESGDADQPVGDAPST